jgi:hypothetical protein
MIKKCAIFGIIIGSLILCAKPVFAYGIDGSLGDWGVTPFINWVPNRASIDWNEEDWAHGNGVRPSGGESYDIEALYFDDDAEYFYFALITSYPHAGSLAGDLAIDFGGAPYTYEYGIPIQSLNPGSQPVGLYSASEWWGVAQGCVGYPVYITNGTVVDPSAEVVYRNAGVLEDYWYDDQVGHDVQSGYGEHVNGSTYILEGKVSRSHIPVGDDIRLHYSLVCGNDYIDLNGDFDTPGVPEPASMLLVGIGAVGFGFVRRKKSV